RRRGRQAEPGVEAEADEEQGGGVRAHTEEDLGPEIELTRPAPDDVAAESQHGVDQDEEADRLVVRGALQLEGNGIEDGGHGAHREGETAHANEYRGIELRSC